MRVLTNALCLLALLALATTAAQAARYDVIDLGNTSAWDGHVAISPGGNVAWTSHAASDSSNHMFVYSGGQTRDLGRIPGSDPVANATNDINDFGMIVGHQGQFPFRGFVWDAEHGTSVLNVPGSMGYSFAFGINNSGHIAAANWGYSGENATNWLLRDGSWTQIPGLPMCPNMNGCSINNNDQMAGGCRRDTSSPWHAWMWAQATGTRELGALGGSGAYANAINDQGSVVGWAATASGTSHACLWNAGTAQDLDTLGSASSTACGVNSAGQVVGRYWDAASGTSRAFLYDNGVMRDVNDLVSPDLGLTFYTAWGISDNGSLVVGGISRAGEQRYYLLTSVPEPSSLLYSAACLCGFALRRRR